MVVAESVQAQVRDILLDIPDITDLIEDRVSLRPLKRAGGMDMANDPTPDFFELQPPQFVKTCIVIPGRQDRFRYANGTTRPSHRYLVAAQRIAYYAPPTATGEQEVIALGLIAARELHGEWITLADGTVGRIVWEDQFTGPVPSPDFAGTAVVAFDQFNIVAVRYRD